MANNIVIKDGGGVSVNVKTTEDLGPPVVHTPHHIVDSITVLQGAAAEGAAIPANVIVVAGDDGTGSPTHPLQIDDSTGGLKVALQAGTNNIGDVDVLTLPAVTGNVGVTSVTLPATIVHGKTTWSSGDPVPLAGSTALTSGVTVKALSGNAALVYVGNSTSVSAANGFELNAKESVFLEVDNLADVFFLASASEGVTYVGS